MKKVKLPEHKAGIWLDQETAYIIHMKGDTLDKVEGLISDVDSRVRMAGEGKVYARFGHTFIDNQEKTQHRQHNQRQHFFKEILTHLKGTNFLYLFGPGQARHGLQRLIEKDHDLAGHVVNSATAGVMNKRLAVIETLAYFNGDGFKQYKKERRKVMKAAL
jgi:hypothetical protein